MLSFNDMRRWCDEICKTAVQGWNV